MSESTDKPERPACAGSPAPTGSPDVVSWDRWKQALDERDEARREIERVKSVVRELSDSPKSLSHHLTSWANASAQGMER